MNNNMKQMLENLPRFEYKSVKFFKDKEEMIKAIDELRNNGINNIVSRTLTNNYINEIYEFSIFLPKEGFYPTIAGLIGGVIGLIIGWIMGNNQASLPLLNSVLSSGRIGSSLLLGGIFSILTASFVGVLTLFKPIKIITPGYHMLTIYSDIESKNKVENILGYYNYEELN